MQIKKFQVKKSFSILFRSEISVLFKFFLLMVIYLDLTESNVAYDNTVQKTIYVQVNETRNGNISFVINPIMKFEYER